MFNPNIVPNFSHRSTTFETLFRETSDKFKQLAGLSEKDLVLFVSGSGTLANEIVISSLKEGLALRTEGDFSNRLQKTSSEYWGRGDVLSGVQYETGISLLNDMTKITFSDSISAFPYYNFPKDAKVITTVGSKQLGSETGLSIITIRDWEENINLFQKEDFSYLSLMKYANKAKINQTPNTPAIHALIDLNTKISAALRVGAIDILRYKIDTCRDLLEAFCDSRGYKYKGNGPVFTFESGCLPKHIENSLYGNSGNPQMFLWDCEISDVEIFIRSF